MGAKESFEESKKKAEDDARLNGFVEQVNKKLKDASSTVRLVRSAKSEGWTYLLLVRAPSLWRKARTGLEDLCVVYASIEPEGELFVTHWISGYNHLYCRQPRDLTPLRWARLQEAASVWVRMDLEEEEAEKKAKAASP